MIDTVVTSTVNPPITPLRPAPRKRIVVGLDGSLASQRALEWAVAQAVARPATVLVVTAIPYGAPGPDGVRRRMADRMAVDAMQRSAIVAARRAVAAGRVVVIGRETVVADPVTALCGSARRADLVVVGSDGAGLRPSSVAGRVAARLGRTPYPSPPLIVRATAGRRATGADPVLTGHLVSA
jgi:nucleotide-binding universal stress UspA family protein